MPVCGNRARHGREVRVRHDTVEGVRACFREEEIWECGWLNELVNPEDGEIVAVACKGVTWYLPDGRGYECEHGHDHIYCEVRASEGWDYAADPQEAGLLAGRGVHPVAMNGGPIDVDPGARAYAASLPG